MLKGMNEIIGPLYYVFAADTDAEWAAHAEADAFYCFQNLMSEIKDNFIRTLDYSDCGIGEPHIFIGRKLLLLKLGDVFCYQARIRILFYLSFYQRHFSRASTHASSWSILDSTRI